MKNFFVQRPVLRRIVYFFPIQLLLVQVKKNHLIVIFWLILFGFITQSVASRYGVGFLFVDPEYLDHVGFLSYFIVGFSCGGFIMAYNISCYIQNAFRFPFLATLSHPFIKFCHNNFIIPTIFLAVYVYNIYNFLGGESVVLSDKLLFISAFLLGATVFILVTCLYFIRTNKDISKLYGIKCDDNTNKRRNIKRVILRRNFQWKEVDINREARDWHVETYFNFPFRIRLARSFEHYDKEMLIHVFKQNHNNAVFFELLALISLLLLGTFRDVPVFAIPAGASVFLLFTMYLVLSGVLHTWFRGWSNTVFVLLLLTFNWVYQFDWFGNRTRAYGMNYSVAPALYSNNQLHFFDTASAWRKEDSLQTIAMLEKWKAKNATGDSLKKPKFVIFTCSGGGLRSTMWTFHTMQYTDSVTHGELLKHTALIFGSSGGMVGAAYMRELLLRESKGEKIDHNDPARRECVSEDMLNPMALSIAVNDLFLPVQKFEFEGAKYSKNRAYAFERKLNENTGHILEKKLGDYAQPEADAIIPMMVFSPTIVNDGRRLVISALGVSYLTQSIHDDRFRFNKLPDGIEFSRFFAKQDATNVRFTSVLRMSGSFPYITPLTELPSNPHIEVFDAGMRDNYGLVSALRFIHTFRTWIEQNTSGIVILQTRDLPKEHAVEPEANPTAMQSLSRPLGSFYGNLFTVQDYNVDRELEYAPQWFSGKLDVLDFELNNVSPDRISLSWHLTNREKAKVLGSMKTAKNQENVRRLSVLLN